MIRSLPVLADESVAILNDTPVSYASPPGLGGGTAGDRWRDSAT
jgi:hypothetical protein